MHESALVLAFFVASNLTISRSNSAIFFLFPETYGGKICSVNRTWKLTRLLMGAKISLPESGRPIRKGLGAGPFGAGEALNA